MAKNNIMSNIDIDMALALNGITLKACDFEDDNNVKTMVRRHHTTAEKKKADAKWRVKFTGKKDGRSRKDYKEAKEKNAGEKDYRSYSRGGYDRHGIIQNRRYNEAMENAMEDIVYNDEIQYEVDHYVRLIEARDYYQNLVDRLQKECDIIKWMCSEFSKKMEAEGVANNFMYQPTVEINSWAFDNLEEARADLAEVESELDWVRKSGDIPSLLTDDGRIYEVEEDNDDYWCEEEEEFEYYR